MNVGNLKELINNLDNNLEIFIRNSVNPCGNISGLEQVEKNTYGSFGRDVDCIILNTADTSEELEVDEEGDYIKFKESNM